jgi:hypothetical protein
MPVFASSNAQAIERLRGPSARFASLGMTAQNKKAAASAAAFRKSNRA